MNKKKLLIIVSVITVILISIVLLFLGKKEKVTYKITFETSGGSLVETQIINEGDKVKEPKDPTKEGYSFIEWLYNGKVYNFNLEVTSDLTLTAKWLENKEDIEKFIVKFNTDGADSIESQIIEKGKKVEKPNDPTKEGYIFECWLLDDSPYDFDIVVDRNIELKAKFEKVEEEKPKEEKPKEEKYTIKFDSKGGSNVSSQTITKGNKVKKPSDPTREGYTFAGWTLNGKNYDFNSKVTSNITLVANWKEIKKNSYTVTFDSNGGSKVDSKTVVEGEKVTKPNDPIRSGYTFEGWTLNGNTYDFNVEVKSNITLVAKWKEIIKNNYTVTFNSNGGSSVSPQTITEGNKVQKPSNPTKEGHKFTSWTLNGSTYNFDAGVSSNITLVANWTQKNYTVTATAADQTSPFSRVLTVYEEGTKITVKTIQYSDGTTLCQGANPNVNYYAIEGEQILKLVLNGGTIVTASLTIN